MRINERIYGNGYKDNKDMIYARVFYLVLLNFLLLLEQIVMIRVFLLRNKKTLFLFEALGMSPKEKEKRNILSGAGINLVQFNYRIFIGSGNWFHIYELYFWRIQ